jgi:hypothetical protein
MQPPPELERCQSLRFPADGDSKPQEQQPSSTPGEVIPLVEDPVDSEKEDVPEDDQEKKDGSG